MIKSVEFEQNGSLEVFEFGKIARQANGSVWYKNGDSVLLATVTVDENSTVEGDFLPLTVQYIEKSYSAGKIPGGFIKRESKPSDFETLTSRIVDRSLRPLFPKGFINPVQITVIVLSADELADMQVMALNAASAALFVSDIPVDISVSAIRVGKVNGEVTVNANLESMGSSSLDILVAGSKDDLLMIEMRTIGDERGDNAVGENELVDILQSSMEVLSSQNSLYEREFSKIAKEPMDIELYSQELNEEIASYVEENYSLEVNEAIAQMAKSERSSKLYDIATSILKDDTALNSAWESVSVVKAVEHYKRKVVRAQILKERRRADGRALDEVRPIEIETNILPRAHSSALFTRGQTQALVALTLGGGKDAQMYENITSAGSEYENFMVHYNFPGFSVGEASRIGPAGRRELGHGNLAKRALEPTLSLQKDETIRIVSEILESNGSSSMATICGASIALKAANIPVTNLVAGVAMGLVTEGEDAVILTDIMGLEDHDGDMDFKVAGPRGGITALQMDIKLGGIATELLKEALNQAKVAKDSILDLMEEATSSVEYSEALPSNEKFLIDPSRIVDVIGQAGKIIRAIIEKFEVEIDLDRDSGAVKVSGKSREGVEGASEHIREIATAPKKERVEVNIGDRFSGNVKRIVDFGAFIEMPNGADGLLHISKISKERVNKVSDVLSEGESVEVEVLEKKGSKVGLGRVTD